MKVSVVILNWNGKKFLEQFLPTLIANTGNDAELIIADNASSDDSISFLQQHYPKIRIIRNAENWGFSRGYNEALKEVESDYYVLLNSDIEVTPNWIKPVIDMMQADPDIGACQPKLIAFDDRDYFEYAGGAGGFIDAYGYPFCRGRMFNTLEKDLGQFDDAREVFWATGACMFVRADLYQKYGGLDNDFFAHMEEIDYCWRLKNAGYKIMYCPDSTVYHVGGGTLPKISSRKTYLNFRNNLILLYKNLPPSKLIPVFIARFFLDFTASMKFLAEGYFKDALAVARAYISFYKSFTQLKIKRSRIPHRNVTGIFRGAIVMEYYLKGRKHFAALPVKKFS